MLTVMFWLWSQERGRTEYTAERVNIAAYMASSNLTLDHEIACVTDMPEGLDPRIRVITPPGEFLDYSIPTWSDRRARGLPQCFRRISLFRPDAADVFGAERYVSMDIDVVIGANIDALFDHDHDFRMFRGTDLNKRPYNGSMIQMTAGCRPKVYTQFTPEGAVKAGQIYVGSDQAWISYMLGWGEATWGLEDGVAWYGHPRNRGGPDRKMIFFPGSPKPWQVKPGREESDRWIAEHYHGDLREAA